MNEVEEMKLKAEIKQIDVETLIKLENHRQELKVKEKESQIKWIFWRNLVLFLVSVISMIGGAMQLYSTYFK